MNKKPLSKKIVGGIKDKLDDIRHGFKFRKFSKRVRPFRIGGELLKPKTIKWIVYRWNLGRLFLMEVRYYLHIRLRKFHDNAFAKKKTYYRYYSRPYAHSVNKASVYAFCVSFIAFMALQYISPFNFSGKPRVAEAGSNTVTWDTQDHLQNNNAPGASGGTTSQNNVVVNTDGTVALTSISVGSGADGNVIVTGNNVNIRELFENDNVTGVTTIRGADKGLNKGGGTYSPSAGSVPQFNDVTITGTGILTTDSPSGINPGKELEFKATGTVTVQNGGRIDASGKGYGGGSGGTSSGIAGSRGYGTGGGYGSGAMSGAGYASGGGGGGYGGGGGNGATYNSSVGAGGPTDTNFLSFGSGGGGAGVSGTLAGGAGGAGGGIIKIQAFSINLNTATGSILANGNIGNIVQSSGGGGSGGAIWIVTTGNFNNLGYVTAKGGNGGASRGGGGGGGGGRMRIDVATSSGSTTPSVSNGNGGCGTYCGLNGAGGVYPNVLPTGYPASGSLRNLKINSGQGATSKWTTIVWSATTNNGTIIKFRTRGTNLNDPSAATTTGNKDTGWTYWNNDSGGTTYYTTSGANILTLPTQWLEIEATLLSDTPNKNYTPLLDNVTVTHNYLDPPATPKTYRTDDTTTEITTYTNQAQVKLKADLGTPFANASPIAPQIELRTDQSFTGSPSAPVGVTVSTIDYTYSCVADPCSAAGEQWLADISGLSSDQTYYYKSRSTDAAGRASAWSETKSFIIEQTPPSSSGFTVKGNVSNRTDYVNQTDDKKIIKAEATLSDNVSTTLDVQFSEDGATWGIYDGTADGAGSNSTTNGENWAINTYATISGITSAPTLTAINLANGNGVWKISADGTKTIYVRFRDNAGNVSGKQFTTQNDWNGTTQGAATTTSQLDLTAGGDVKLASSVALGTGDDCDVTIAASNTRTIEEIYENPTVTGVTLANCTNPAKNGSNVGLNYGNTYAPGTAAIPNFKSLTINGTLTTAALVKIDFKVKESLTINTGGKIDASGRGYVGGVGKNRGGYPSGTQGGGYAYSGDDEYCYWSGGGGAYGGNGGNMIYFMGDVAGGTAYNTDFPNFGSGGGGCGTTNPANGGNGGGSINILANNITVNGNIIANGSEGTMSLTGYGGGGGGSGGGIHIVSPNNVTVSGSSIITARGANGLSGGGYTGSGGGGAGRITIEAPKVNDTIVLSDDNVTTADSLKGGEAGVGGDGSGEAGAAGVYTFTQLTPYQPSGTLGVNSPYTGLRVGDPSGPQYKWLNLKWTGSGLSSTYKIGIKVRPADAWGSGSYVNPSDGSASFYYFVPGSSGTIPLLSSFANTKTFEIQLQLEGDGSNTPVLSDLSIEYPLSDQITLDSTPPAVASDTVTSPNSAETWLGGSNHNITWNTAGISDANLLASPIKLEYTTNNGSSWTVIGNSDVTPLSNSGTYAWNPIPSADSTQVKVKITATDVAGNYTSDESNAAFVIDTTGPTQGIVDDANLAAITNSLTFNVPYNASDSASGIDYVKLFYTTQTASPYTWTLYGTTHTSSPISFTASTNATYGFKIISYDKVALREATEANDPPANTAVPEASIIVDNVAPATTITMPESPAACGTDPDPCAYGGVSNPWSGQITGTITDTQTAITKAEIQIQTSSIYWDGTDPNKWDGSGSTWVLANVTSTGPTSASFAYDISHINFADGNTYIVKVKSTDEATNTETAVERSFIYDSSPPNSGTFVINSGNPTYTKSQSINTLWFTNVDNDVRSAPQYTGTNGGLRISNDGTFDTEQWESYDASTGRRDLWALTVTDGTKQVWIQWRDRAGNISAVIITDTIIMDLTPSTSDILTPANNLKTNAIAEISGTVTDETSGVTNASQIKMSITKDDSGTAVYWSGVMWLPYADLSTTYVLQADEILGAKPDYTFRRNAYLPDDWALNLTKDYVIKVKTVDDATNDGTVATSNVTFDNIGPSQPSVSSSSHANTNVWYTTKDVSLAFSSTDTVGVTGYSYTWSLTPTDPDNAEDADAAGGTLSKLSQADGAWYFRVKARDEAGNWSAYSQLIVRIDTTAPTFGDPAFAANGVSDTVIDLSWGAYLDPSSGVKEYKVYRSTLKANPVSTSTSDPNIDPSSLTYTNLVSTETSAKTPATPLHDTDLAQGWYYYAIYAYDNAQSSANQSLVAYSHSKTNFIPDSITFRVNTSAGPVSVNPGDNRNLSLTWTTTDPDGAGDIITTRVTVKKPDDSVLATFDQTDPRMVRASVANGYQITATYALPADLTYGNYSILVTTIDTIVLNAHTKNSNTVVVKVIPDKPANVTVTGYSSTQIDLSWQAPPYVGAGTQYEIYRSASSDSGDVAWNTPIITVGTLTHRDSTLLADTTYYYKLKTVDANSNKSAFSDLTTQKTPTPAVPNSSAVKLIDASSVEAPVENRFVLVWNDPVAGTDTTLNGITGYQIEIAEDDVYVRTAETTNKYLVDLNLPSSKKFTYRIRTKDSFNNLSKISESPTKEGIPGSKPSVSISSVEVGVSSATIKWTATQESETQALYSTNKDDLTNSNAAPSFAGVGGRRTAGAEHKVDIAGLKPNTTYYYKIVSRNILGFANDFDVDAHTFKTQDFSIDSSVSIKTNSSSISVQWKTTLPSDSLVEYQIVTKKGMNVTSEDLKNASSLMKGGAFKSDPVTEHAVDFAAIPGSKYSYRIVSKTNDGYIAYYPPVGSGEWPTFLTPSDDNAKISVTPDATKVAEENITATSARIAWDTAIPTTSWVDYGLEPGKYSMSAGDNQLNTHHVIDLKNLTPGQLYYYKVRGKDASELEYISSEYQFTAVLRPEIPNIKIKSVTSYAATIFWESNVNVETMVAYGKDEALGLRKVSSEQGKAHEVTLESLDDNTQYYFQVLAKDKHGNETKSDVFNFKTPLDTTGAEIKDLKIDLLPMGTEDEYAGVIISWNTNKPAAKQIEYGEGVISGKYEYKTTEDSNMSTGHTVIVKDLNPSSTYHFRIKATDKRGNITHSQDFSFVTPTKEKSILQLIIKSLEETFSWVKNIGGLFKRG